MILSMYSLAIIAASFIYINEPVVNMREHPSVDSEVVSQAIFGEKISVAKQDSNWLAITTGDGYLGWVLSETIVYRKEPYTPSIRVSRLAAHMYDQSDVRYGPIKTVPYGTMLQVRGTEKENWIIVVLPDGKDGYIRRGDIVADGQLLTKAELIDVSQKFLGVPYTWGGRSSFGFDCSGFVQMLYAQIGVSLPRDSAQQIKDTKLRMISIEELEPCDLVFFGLSAQEIKHVGMYIGNQRFIHSSNRGNTPWVSISNLSDDTWSGGRSSCYPYRIGGHIIEMGNDRVSDVKKFEAVRSCNLPKD